MTELELRSIRATLLRCKGQHARPLGMSKSEVDVATNNGYLRFHEWPSGHYEITPKGQSLIAEFAPAE